MRAFLTAALLLLGAAVPLDAQSLFGSRGLGVPVPALDARARALGGLGIGLYDLNTGFINPAEVAGVGRRGIVAAMQPTRRTLEFEGERDRLDATRFPMLRFLYPMGARTVLTGGYGSFLDQSWAVTTEGIEVIGERTVPTRDVIRSTGGLSQVQIGAAFMLTEALAVGAAAGLYTGQLRQEVIRSFPDPEDQQLVPFSTTAEWEYLAPLLSAGFRWDLAPAARVAGSVTWAGDLRVRDGDGFERDFQLPLQLAGGASGRLTPNLTATLAGRWSGWSSGSDDFEDGAADTWEAGAGLEWTGMTARERVFPIRFGHHRASLPFRFGGEQPREQATAFGVGAGFGGTPQAPLARLDGTVERGTRNDDAGLGLSEQFWRFTASLSLFGL